MDKSFNLFVGLIMESFYYLVSNLCPLSSYCFLEVYGESNSRYTHIQ